jgi:KDO2-lipid IV(A) lauroyltransferase
MAEAAQWLRRGGRRSLFAAFRILACVAGLRYAPAFGRILGELEYRIAWRRSRSCARDMACLFGRPVGDPWIASRLRRAHWLNARAALEILAMLDRRQDEAMLAARLEVEGLDNLRASLAEGRGAILLGTHAGNGVLLAVRLVALGFPVTTVYRQSRMAPAGFLGRGLALYGVEPIEANDGLRAYARMTQAVKRGRIVFVTLDQGVKRPQDGIGVRFLGKDMSMAAGPAQLCRRTGAPVLPLLASAGAGPWRFRIEPPLRAHTGPLAEDVQRLARASERQPLLHPELWSWQHRRWRKLAFAHATIAGWKEENRPCTTSTHQP